MVTILVVEDDRNLQKLMETVLKNSGYRVFVGKNGVEALDIIDRKHIDLMISDIMMPDMDGYSLVESLRQANYNLPILLVTAKETFEDKRKGFHLGIDDYMVKPIDMDEMILRVEALLRRSKIMNENRLTVGEVVLDYNTLIISKKEKYIELPKKEFEILFKLLSYPKQIFTRQQLMNEIWGLESETDERTVDVHIKRLRDKLADFKEFEIITVRGLGYKVEIKE